MRTWNLVLGMSAVALVAALGCSDDDTDDAGATGGAGGMAGTGGSDPGTGGGDPGTGGTDPGADEVEVSEDITTDTTWTSDKVYRLTKPIYVRCESRDCAADERPTLTIEAGTKIIGERAENEIDPGALIVTRNGLIDAQGTASNPIVFTAATAEGERLPGEWGGVALLGRSPVNTVDDDGTPNGEEQLEGTVAANDEDVLYGTPYADFVSAGGDGGAGGGGAGGGGNEPSIEIPAELEAWDCGTLRYVRIEFAGNSIGSGDELNGLQVAGCGRDTVLDFIQVHKGSDDGIEIFGGTVDLKHAVITGSEDDGLDWDQGWRGRAQFIAIQHHVVASDDPHCIEADGYASKDFPVAPGSAPRLFNVTMLAAAGTARAARFREGTSLVLQNAIVLADDGGATTGLIDIDDSITADNIVSGDFVLENSVFFTDNWPSEGTAPSDAVSCDGNGDCADGQVCQDDGTGTGDKVCAYLELLYLLPDGPGSEGSAELSSDDILPDPWNQTEPGWYPTAGYLDGVEAVAVAPSEMAGMSGFFDADAEYLGAFEPGVSADEAWTAGWTAFPAD